jgi:Ca2+/Na+ antiporter
MNIPHIRNGFLMGISCIVATLFLYFVSIYLMLGMRLLVLFCLYIYWMRQAVKETNVNAQHPFIKQELFKTAWLTFILGITISMVFMHIFANYIDPNIITLTQQVSVQSQNDVANIFNLSAEKLKEVQESVAYTNPYSLRLFATQLPSFFVIPGAILAFAISRIVKPTLTNNSTQDKISTL